MPARLGRDLLFARGIPGSAVSAGLSCAPLFLCLPPRAVEGYPMTTKNVILEELRVGTIGVFADAGFTGGQF